MATWVKEVGIGDCVGVITVVDDGTCNKGEWAVGGRDRDDTNTIAVGVKGDEEEEGIIDGDSLERLSSIVLGQLA
jgi:hypothetical protein